MRLGSAVLRRMLTLAGLIHPNPNPSPNPSPNPNPYPSPNPNKVREKMRDDKKEQAPLALTLP